MVVDILHFEWGRAFGGAFAFLLTDPMNASARVYVVVDRPIRALATVREGSGHFLEAGIEGKIVPHGVL